MVIYEDVIKKIEEIAPPNLAPQWDNSGVQIYAGKDRIEKILVCLEVNGEIIKEAKENKADLIVSHHPLIFRPIKSIDPWRGSKLPSSPSKVAEQVTARYLTDLIKAEISVYSAHISFDSAPLGNNAYLAGQLGIEDAYIPEEEDGSPTIGCIGYFKREKSLEEALDLLSKVKGISREEMRWVGLPDRAVKKVALCTGGGGDLLPIAIAQGCDLIITGDVRFHEGQLAHATGIALIDAGHFGTEKLFEQNFADQLKQALGVGVNVMTSRVWGDPFAK